ncbi:hypothetical protein Dsin_002689 [Dipteronia sinensis]|uniref:Reverse transcriptase n=1 Tax=Dipteronia sinensis TaxID=43782 RepID=A0AAE0B7J7_9ROSI|nr:hypothetical protein Dsin_002689 [Dipteronia sinensis]
MAEKRKELTSFRYSRGGHKITYLYFTNDSMLFTKASERDCRSIKTILDCYARASGQVVNYQKSALCVSRRVHFVACHERYLGLPNFAGQNKNELFASIQNRVWNRLKWW